MPYPWAAHERLNALDLNDAIADAIAAAAGGSFTAAGAGAVVRTAQAKAREVVSVDDFGGDPTGSTDNLAALNAAAATVGAGQDIRIIVPRGIRSMSAPFTGNGRKVTLDIAPGTTWTGAANPPYYLPRAESVSAGAQTRAINNPVPAAGGVAGELLAVTNTSTLTGYGIRFNYSSAADGSVSAVGNDIAQGRIVNWSTLKGSSGWGLWDYCATPTAAMTPWGVVNAEINPTNRGVDRGWQPQAGQATWCGGYRFVAERGAYLDPPDGIGTHVLFALAVAGNNNGPNNNGIEPRIYNGLMIEHDSIGPDGRGVHASGDTTGTPAKYPSTGFQVADTWKYGLRMEGATITTGHAVALGTGHKAAWINGSLAELASVSGAAAGLTFATAGGTAFKITDPGAATWANYLTLTAAATTGSPSITVAGSDTNSGLTISTKGSGGLRLNINGATALRCGDGGASAVNYVQAVGAVTTGAPVLLAQGSDAVVALSLQGKAGGGVQMGTTSDKLGFAGTAPITRPVLSYSRATAGETAAEAAMRAALASLGLITDSTTA